MSSPCTSRRWMPAACAWESRRTNSVSEPRGKLGIFLSSRAYIEEGKNSKFFQVPEPTGKLRMILRLRTYMQENDTSHLASLGPSSTGGGRSEFSQVPEPIWRGRNRNFSKCQNLRESLELTCFCLFSGVPLNLEIANQPPPLLPEIRGWARTFSKSHDPYTYMESPYFHISHIFLHISFIFLHISF